MDSVKFIEILILSKSSVHFVGDLIIMRFPVRDLHSRNLSPLGPSDHVFDEQCALPTAITIL